MYLPISDHSSTPTLGKWPGIIIAVHLLPDLRLYALGDVAAIDVSNPKIGYTSDVHLEVPLLDNRFIDDNKTMLNTSLQVDVSRAG